ncbi:hypothetical protein TWF569_005008 [Orbilia oligospora]|uniref:CBM1 domain-containing protein n=1 Tax=Orbilia oligospora TaxID=2813651 RepID=A0A7C8K3C7_ORBOL|nr:hypothetical protein TWF706_009952 [Orbilia oligospora]KAF3099107.1 hypothetical protein TWF103_008876 [Orbilia oligospora]KAF3101938.1 hypothetical protein TWF102_004676 [Orbilia oligospora]KAF3121280.1 hypothetical protein TWF594_003397 [Orbilia oligospora]KAF3146692.1 hypothetical protein TWF703_003963 [Orbilia oligospora]
MKFTIALAIAALTTSTIAADCSTLRPIYSQCGGVQYTGCGTCANNAICTYVNAYYSQCYPKPN